MNRRIVFAAVSLFVALAASATVFEPRTDRELTARADAVVVALVRDAVPHLRKDGSIATDYHLIVEQTLKGDAAGTITVSELGGVLGTRITFIADGAAYAPGERVVAFLRARGDGTYFTESMAMGRFAIRGDLAVREVGEMPDDPPRRLDAFVKFVRGESQTPGLVAKTNATHPPIVASGAAKNYALLAGPYPVRWQGCETACPGGSVKFYVSGTMSFSPTAGINAALAAWTNDPNSSIALTNAGSSALVQPNANDNTNVIYLSYGGSFNNGVCDGSMACTIGSGNFTHTFDGDTWVSISDADIIVSASVPQSLFASLMTHEIGHAIGFRHSDQGTPASSQAIMNSSVSSGYGTTLQQWDKDAVDSLYGTGPVCQQPANVTTNPSGQATVAANQPVNITSFVAAGTLPFTYQWYQGAQNDTTNPVGTNASNYQTAPITAPTSYWVKVTNACGSANSPTVTLSPAAGCQKPAVTTQPQNQTINSGGFAQLSVGATGTPTLFYQWYQGPTGDTTTAVAGATLPTFTTPSLGQTTSYWVQVTNSCGFANSSAAVITVNGGQCTPPSFVVQPSSVSIASGQQTYLVAAATPATSYQWYRGTAPDTSTPLAGVAPSNARFVNQLYLDLLGRPSDAGASAIVADLDASSLTRFGAAVTVDKSVEYRTRLVTTYYNRFLRRNPTPSEITYWLPAFIGGMTDEQLESQILASPEYFAIAGGTNLGWVQQVYKDVLNNPTPPASSVSIFVGALATNARTAVAPLFTESTEAKTRLVQSWFANFLRRSPTAAELNAFVAAIAGSSADDEETLAQILASNEYFNFGTILPTGPLSDTTSFWVQAVNGNCATNSNTAIVAINSCVPVIGAQPQNQTIGVGNDATLAVIASAAGSLSYQWYQGQVGDTSKPLSGQTSATLNGYQISAPGTYSFWVRITSACKSVDSAAAIVTVTCSDPPAMFVNIPPTVMSGKSYTAGVTIGAQVFSKYELQESTSADFTNATTYASTNGIFSIPGHTVTTQTLYYYRVRGFLSCNNNQPGAYSATSTTLILAPIPNVVPAILNLVTGPCIAPPCTILQPFHIFGINPSGKNALATTTTYSITADKPWITITPSSGTLPPDGLDVNVTVDATSFDVGSTEATITLTKNTAVQSAGNASVLDTTVSTGNTPVSVSLVSSTTPTPKSTTIPNNTLLVPAIAHADGFGGSHFQSDVRLTNTATQAISYQLTFTPSNIDGTTSGKSTTINVQAGTTVALNDIVQNFFGSGVLGQPGAGSLEVRPLNYSGKGEPGHAGANDVNVQLATVVSSRTYNATPTGTYGQFVPALPLVNFLAKSDVSKISLQQVADSKAYRTNIGFAEGSGEPADIVATLFDTKGNQLGQRAYHLLPFQQTQSSMAGFFGLAGGSIPEGRVEIAVTSDTGKVTAYASVLDNATSDPLLVFPTDPSKITSSRYVVPGVADLAGAAGSNFHTDMRIYNAGSAQANVTLNYVPQGDTPPPSPAAVTMTVAPGEVKTIDNVLPSLWNLTGTGGAVVATSDNPSKLVFTARTYSRNDTGGTYGQFIPGVTAGDAVGVGDRALNVVQLEQSPSFRSNVGLAEVTGNAALVEIKGYAPDNKTVATAQRLLNPGEFIQLNAILASMGFGNVYNGRVGVRVIDGTGRVAAYGSIIDNRTQDPTYVPAQ